MFVEKDVSLNTQIDQCLSRISNVLLLNSSFIENLGLINGKMGISVFFYKYARYTQNEIYERYAGELIDEIYEEINQTTPVDLANGLTGIGWGIEYLVQNGYLDANTDEALIEIDNEIYKNSTWTPLSIIDQSSLFGYGFYCLTRLKGQVIDDNNLETLKKKQLLIYLMDECERLLTKELLFEDIRVPKFTLYQINSLTWFILQTHKLGLFPVKSNKLIKQLIDYIETKMESGYGYLDSKVFAFLSRELTGIGIIEKTFNTKIQDIVNASINHEDDEQMLNEFIKTGWNPILYDTNISLPNEIVEKTIQIINNKENWNQRLNKLNKGNIGWDTGMAGLGMALLNHVDKNVSK